MKTKYLSNLISLFCIVAINFLASEIAHADPKVKFYCGKDNQDIPTTFAKTPDKDIAIITWNKWLSGFSPQKRCEQVSANFQKANKKDTLELIHNSVLKGEKVICTATKPQGACDTVLMTLRSEDDSLRILNDLKDIIGFARQFSPIQNSGGETHLYYQIDWGSFLR